MGASFDGDLNLVSSRVGTALDGGDEVDEKDCKEKDKETGSDLMMEPTHEHAGQVCPAPNQISVW